MDRACAMSLGQDRLLLFCRWVLCDFIVVISIQLESHVSPIQLVLYKYFPGNIQTVKVNEKLFTFFFLCART